MRFAKVLDSDGNLEALVSVPDIDALKLTAKNYSSSLVLEINIEEHIKLSERLLKDGDE